MGHEHQVPRLHGDIRPGADGDADVGLGQGRGVVDAVADEGHPAALGLEGLHRLRLAAGQDLTQGLVDTRLLRRQHHRRRMVATDQDGVETQGLETGDGLDTALPEGIGNPDESQGPSVAGDINQGATLGPQFRRSGRQGG